MSSPYPYGGTQFCQRCRAPLPANEIYCSNCGNYNTPAQGNAPAEYGQSASQWGGAPSTSYGQDQYSSGNQGWGQSPMATPMQNSGYAQTPSAQPPAGYPNPFTPPVGSLGVGSNFYNNAAPPANQSPFGMPSTPPMMGGYQQMGMNTPPMAVPPLYSPQSPKQNKGKTGLYIAVAAVALVVIVGGVAAFALLNAHNSGTSTSGTSTTAIPTPNTPVLFSDPLTNNQNGWNLQSDPGKYSVAIGNGVMTLEDDNNKLLWELVPGGKTFSDFTLNVDATLSKGDQNNGYGVYIRGASNQQSELATYYRFELYGDGVFAIFKGTVDSTGASTATKMVGYTSNSAIQKQGGVNHITIVAKGSSMSFDVNGTTLGTINDNGYASGSVALFVSNLQDAKPGAQAQFSKFAIYSAKA